MNNYTVYMHVAPNDKKYIGITRLSVQKRWLKGNGYKHNAYFSRAIQKYGWENIKHKILYTNLSKEEAEQKEIELIAYYNSNKKIYGYNIDNGGNTIGKQSEETRKKISLANLGKKRSTETLKKMSDIQKEKISNSLKGRSVWNKGLKLKRRSDEIKKKTSKQVICIETGIVYFGIREAERQTGIKHEYICKCCEGKGKSAKGFHWRYYSE